MNNYSRIGFVLQLIRVALALAVVAGTATSGNVATGHAAVAPAAIVFGAGALMVPLLWVIQLTYPRPDARFHTALLSAKTIESAAAFTALLSSLRYGWLPLRMIGLVVLISVADVIAVSSLLLWGRRIIGINAEEEE